MEIRFNLHYSNGEQRKHAYLRNTRDNYQTSLIKNNIKIETLHGVGRREEGCADKYKFSELQETIT